MAKVLITGDDFDVIVIVLETQLSQAGAVDYAEKALRMMDLMQSSLGLGVVAFG